MKKVLALLLSLVMILALGACTVEEEKGIADTWKWSVELSAEKMGLAGVDAKLTMISYIDLKEDGTYSVKLDKDALLASVSAFEAALVEVFVQQLGGESMRELAEQTVAQMNLGQKMAESAEDEYGTYTINGDQITMTPNEDSDAEAVTYTFKLEGDTLELTGDSEDMEQAMELLGEAKMVLTRTRN